MNALTLLMEWAKLKKLSFMKDDIQSWVDLTATSVTKISELVDQNNALTKRIQKKDEALKVCYGFFNARIPKHREYDMIDMIRDAMENK